MKLKITGQLAYEINIERGIKVDTQDEDLLYDHLWHINNMGYVCRSGEVCKPIPWRSDKYRTVKTIIILHREIADRMNLALYNIIVPKDGDYKNCQRNNLECITRSEFRKNLKPNKQSGVKGIQYYNRLKKWKIVFFYEGIRYNGGVYDSLEEAKLNLEKCRNKVMKGGIWQS